MKVFVVMFNDYESGDSHAGEFSASSKVAGVFSSRKLADEFVDKQYGGNDPSDVPWGLEVRAHEMDSPSFEAPDTARDEDDDEEEEEDDEEEMEDC